MFKWIFTCSTQRDKDEVIISSLYLLLLASHIICAQRDNIRYTTVSRPLLYANGQWCLTSLSFDLTFLKWSDRHVGGISKSDTMKCYLAKLFSTVQKKVGCELADQKVKNRENIYVTIISTYPTSPYITGCTGYVMLLGLREDTNRSWPGIEPLPAPPTDSCHAVPSATVH